MRRFLMSACIAPIALAALPIDAHAQQPVARVQVGVLECRGGASVGFIVGSVTNLGCVLRIEGLPEDRYVATIRKVGLDLGITQETALAWGVYAPVARLGPGDLSGNYAGAQGSASVGVGLGGNVLVGGSDNSIALQPLSVQGQVGLNVAAGLESLELRPGRYCSRKSALHFRGMFSVAARGMRRLFRVVIVAMHRSEVFLLAKSFWQAEHSCRRPNYGPSSR